MIAIRLMLRRLGADTRGATAIEYGLICSLIIIAMMTGLVSLGGGSAGMWGKIQNDVELTCKPVSARLSSGAPRSEDYQLDLLAGHEPAIHVQPVERQEALQLEIAVCHPVRERLHGLSRYNGYNIDDSRPDRRRFLG